MKDDSRRDVLDRFLRYVRIDTQSDPASQTVPSTEKQKDLSRLLVTELKDLGLRQVEMTDTGYVYATLPSNLESGKEVPTVGFIAHVDTSPEVSGSGVNPIVHENYDGGDLRLPGDPSLVIRAGENPELSSHKGDSIVTSDGTTLLGADDKSGVAVIMTALRHLKDHPKIRHGTIAVAFTPDEEIGRSADHFDVKRFGADYAYTLDGSRVGDVENETFCADAMKVTVLGVNVHPGYAKGKLVNSMKVAGEILAALPIDEAPESTEKRQGFIHPVGMTGNVEKTTIDFIVRDFEEKGLKDRERRIRETLDAIVQRREGARLEVEIKESYRNMRLKLDEAKEVVDLAIEGVRRAGVEPRLQIIRGGTDGARLCFMGLPTPNLFTGMQNFHSRTEWIAVGAMEKSVSSLIEIVKLWAEYERR